MTSLDEESPPEQDVKSSVPPLPAPRPQAPLPKLKRKLTEIDFAHSPRTGTLHDCATFWDSIPEPTRTVLQREFEPRQPNEHIVKKILNGAPKPAWLHTIEYECAFADDGRTEIYVINALVHMFLCDVDTARQFFDLESPKSDRFLSIFTGRATAGGSFVTDDREDPTSGPRKLASPRRQTTTFA